MKKSFPIFGNGNGRPVFPGMAGNGNSRSALGDGVQRSIFLEYQIKPPPLIKSDTLVTVMDRPRAKAHSQ